MLFKNKLKMSFTGAIPSLWDLSYANKNTVLLYSLPSSKQALTSRQGIELQSLPATLIFSSATKLGTAVVELVKFVPVPLITRLSTFDSNLPMRCKMLSNNTARVFFKSVKENVHSLKILWSPHICLVRTRSPSLCFSLWHEEQKATNQKVPLEDLS